MPRTSTLWISTAAAFAGGLVAGLFVAPTSGRALRKQIADCTRAQGSRVEERLQQRLQQLDAQLTALEEQVQATTAALGRRWREAAEQALDTYRPAVPESSWGVEPDDLARELRHLPRR